MLQNFRSSLQRELVTQDCKLYYVLGPVPTWRFTLSASVFFSIILNEERSSAGWHNVRNATCQSCCTLPYCCPHTAWWQSESCSWVQRQHWGNPWHASTAGPSPPVPNTQTQETLCQFFPLFKKYAVGLMFVCLHRAVLHSGKCWAESGRGSRWWNTDVSWHGAQETSHHESTCEQDTSVLDAPNILNNLSKHFAFPSKQPCVEFTIGTYRGCSLLTDSSSWVLCRSSWIFLTSGRQYAYAMSNFSTLFIPYSFKNTENMLKILNNSYIAISSHYTTTVWCVKEVLIKGNT